MHDIRINKRLEQIVSERNKDNKYRWEIMGGRRYFRRNSGIRIVQSEWIHYCTDYKEEEIDKLLRILKEKKWFIKKQFKELKKWLMSDEDELFDLAITLIHTQNEEHS